MDKKNEKNDTEEDVLESESVKDRNIIIFDVGNAGKRAKIE
ncbi:hypothetical protein [Fictibacillus sp. 26RED30]|nr:hypothetical protein [Fictibacillus sp. 26RED30]